MAEPKAEVAGSGSAFAINKNGDFLTNYHVVKSCVSVRLRNAGLRGEASVIANDERNDLAVVQGSNFWFAHTPFSRREVHSPG